MNPASSRGMMVDIPSPAGVMAPVRLMPTVTSSSSISSVNRRHPSARRPEGCRLFTELMLEEDVTVGMRDRKSTRLNSSHLVISYAVFCLKKKKENTNE